MGILLEYEKITNIQKKKIESSFSKETSHEAINCQFLITGNIFLFIQLWELTTNQVRKRKNNSSLFCDTFQSFEYLDGLVELQ